jgi:hypothetical protein
VESRHEHSFAVKHLWRSFGHPAIVERILAPGGE